MAETFTYSDLHAIRDVNLVACKQLFSCWRSNAPHKKSAIKMAWERGGADFRLRFDKSIGQAELMKEGGAPGAVM